MTQVIPPEWQRVRATGRYFHPDGSPVVGYVSFKMGRVILADGTSIALISFTGQIVNGLLDISLLATDDPLLSRQGWVYTVTERFRGARPPYLIEVPAAGGEIDLGLAPPMVPLPVLASSRGPAGEKGPTGDVTPAALQAVAAAQLAKEAAEVAATVAEAAANTEPLVSYDQLVFNILA